MAAPAGQAGTSAGGGLAGGVIAVASVSSASFNPMRSLAPMIVSGTFPAWLGHVVGPSVGGVLGALAYDRLIRPGEPPEAEGAVEEHERGEL